jgi:hypothetical protein
MELLTYIYLSACVISVLRLTSLRASTKSVDITWDKAYSAFYGVIEVNTGILCSCIVTLRPLFHHLIPSLDHWRDALGRRPTALDLWKFYSGQTTTHRESSETAGSERPTLTPAVELAASKQPGSVVETKSVSVRGAT